MNPNYSIIIQWSDEDSNIVGRAIEAHGRGFWNADDEKLEKLRELYQSAEDELEGVTV